MKPKAGGARLMPDWQLAAAFVHDPGPHTEAEGTFTASRTGAVVRLKHRTLENPGATAQVRDSEGGGSAVPGGFSAGGGEPGRFCKAGARNRLFHLPRAGDSQPGP